VDKIAVLALCIALAWGTKVAVEDPTQRSSLLRRTPVVAVLTVVAMAVVASVAAWQWRQVGQQEAAAAAEVDAAANDPCFGAGSLAPDAVGCTDVFGPPASLTLPPDDEPWFIDPACPGIEGELPMSICRYGDGAPERRVALVGDSHAEHWRGAIHEIAREHNWEIVEILRGACPVTEARVLAFHGNSTDTDGCEAWGRRVTEYLAEEPVDDVITSSFASAFTFESTDGSSSLEAGTEGFVATWTAWAETGARVHVLRDIPTTAVRHVPECLMANATDPLECSSPRSEAVVPDAATAAVERAGSDRIGLVDMTDFFCDESTCYTAIGGAVVYWDADHLSAQYSRSLAPYVYEEISAG
jgi:hypothetical protein